MGRDKRLLLSVVNGPKSTVKSLGVTDGISYAFVHPRRLKSEAVTKWKGQGTKRRRRKEKQGFRPEKQEVESKACINVFTCHGYPSLSINNVTTVVLPLLPKTKNSGNHHRTWQCDRRQSLCVEET